MIFDDVGPRCQRSLTSPAADALRQGLAHIGALVSRTARACTRHHRFQAPSTRRGSSLVANCLIACCCIVHPLSDDDDADELDDDMTFYYTRDLPSRPIYKSKDVDLPPPLPQPPVTVPVAAATAAAERTNVRQRLVRACTQFSRLSLSTTAQMTYLLFSSSNAASNRPNNNDSTDRVETVCKEAEEEKEEMKLILGASRNEQEQEEEQESVAYWQTPALRKRTTGAT